MVRHRLQESVHQRHVDHRGLVDDEQVAFQRVILLAPEAAVYGIGFQEPMDRLRLTAGAFRQPLGRPAGRRGQRDVDGLDPQDFQDRVDQRRLADTGTAGDDEDLRSQRQPHRLALALGEGDARFALDPRNGLLGIDRWPRQRTGRESSQATGDGTLGPMQPGEKDAGLLVHGVGDHLAVIELQIERALDDRGWHLEQLGGHRQQLLARQPAVPVIHRLGQRVADTGTGADHRRLLDAELPGDQIGALEADAADVAGEPVRVLGHDANGVGAVGLENAHCPRRADAVAVQEDHDLADRLLIRPGGDDALGPLRADAVDLVQAFGLLLDDFEHRLAERPDQFLGVDRADAPDHARGEVLLDALGGRGWCRT
jgi:hypothetical protein